MSDWLADSLLVSHLTNSYCATIISKEHFAFIIFVGAVLCTKFCVFCNLISLKPDHGPLC